MHEQGTGLKVGNILEVSSKSSKLLFRDSNEHLTCKSYNSTIVLNIAHLALADLLVQGELFVIKTDISCCPLATPKVLVLSPCDFNT